jgi:hypothetical protein
MTQLIGKKKISVKKEVRTKEKVGKSLFVKRGGIVRKNKKRTAKDNIGKKKVANRI